MTAPERAHADPSGGGSWMRVAVCQAFPELPWLSDSDEASELDRLRMVSVCRSCGCFELCAAFAVREHITGGFWAGEFRDHTAPAVRIVRLAADDGSGTSTAALVVDAGSR